METPMELDDFKQAWQTLDRRLEQQNTLSLRLYADGKLEKARALGVETIDEAELLARVGR